MITIQAVGGESIFSTVIGGKSKYHIDNIKNKWDIHKRIGKKEFLLKTLNEIIKLPEYINDSRMLLDIVRQIWDMPNEKIFCGIIKSLELNEPIMIAKKNLFWKWKEFIEVAIMIYLKLTIPKINIKRTLLKWSAYVKKNNIDTSSITLWCLYNDKSPWYKKYETSIEQFIYLGYCPDAADARITALMAFPLDKLLNYILAKVNIVGLSKDINEINEQLAKQLKSIAIPEKINEIEKQKIISNDLETFMDSWVGFNVKLQPYLEEQEKQYIEIAKKIDKISNEINKINNKFRSQLW